MSFWDRFKKDKPAAAASRVVSTDELTASLRSKARGAKVSAADVASLCQELGIAQEQAYVALAMMDNTSLATEHEVQFVICTGNCLERGAMACLHELIALRDSRLSAELPAFDIVPRRCLTRCQVAPAVEVRSSAGTAVLANATPKALKEAVGDLF